ncbi:MAG: hypothetical protein ACRBBK_02940 [Paracoccaceae bacterium]
MPPKPSSAKSATSAPAADDEIIVATLMPSLARRMLGVGMLGLLGLLLIMLVINAPNLDMSPGLADPNMQDLNSPKSMGAGTKAFLVICGGLALFACSKLYAATARGVELTNTGILRETGPEGRILARVEDVKAVERGSFALKPSNGFSLTFHQTQERGFALGLWWRAHKRLGVGGVTPASQGKFMAELIVAQIAARG